MNPASYIDVGQLGYPTTPNGNSYDSTEDCTRIIQASLSKILDTKCERKGPNLRKSLMVLRVIQRARTEQRNRYYSPPCSPLFAMDMDVSPSACPPANLSMTGSPHIYSAPNYTPSQPILILKSESESDGEDTENAHPTASCLKPANEQPSSPPSESISQSASGSCSWRGIDQSATTISRTEGDLCPITSSSSLPVDEPMEEGDSPIDPGHHSQPINLQNYPGHFEQRLQVANHSDDDDDDDDNCGISISRSPLNSSGLQKSRNAVSPSSAISSSNSLDHNSDQFVTELSDDDVFLPSSLLASELAPDVKAPLSPAAQQQDLVFSRQREQLLAATMFWAQAHQHHHRKQREQRSSERAEEKPDNIVDHQFAQQQHQLSINSLGFIGDQMGKLAKAAECQYDKSVVNSFSATIPSTTLPSVSAQNMGSTSGVVDQRSPSGLINTVVAANKTPINVVDEVEDDDDDAPPSIFHIDQSTDAEVVNPFSTDNKMPSAGEFGEPDNFNDETCAPPDREYDPPFLNPRSASFPPIEDVTINNSVSSTPHHFLALGQDCKSSNQKHPDNDQHAKTIVYWPLTPSPSHSSSRKRKIERPKARKECQMMAEIEVELAIEPEDDIEPEPGDDNAANVKKHRRSSSLLTISTNRLQTASSLSSGDNNAKLQPSAVVSNYSNNNIISQHPLITINPITTTTPTPSFLPPATINKPDEPAEVAPSSSPEPEQSTVPPPPQNSSSAISNLISMFSAGFHVLMESVAVGGLLHGGTGGLYQSAIPVGREAEEEGLLGEGAEGSCSCETQHSTSTTNSNSNSHYSSLHHRGHHNSAPLSPQSTSGNSLNNNESNGCNGFHHHHRSEPIGNGGRSSGANVIDSSANGPAPRFHQTTKFLTDNTANSLALPQELVCH